MALGIVNRKVSGIPTGASLAGDVTGVLGATTVEALRGVPLSPSAPAVGDVLIFDGLEYTPGTLDPNALYPQATGLLAVGTTVIDGVDWSEFVSCEWDLLLENASSRYRARIYAVHNNLVANLIEALSIPGPGVTVVPVSLDADLDATEMRLLATATAPGWSYRVRRLGTLASP